MADLASPRFLTASVSIPKNLRRNDRHRGYHTRSVAWGFILIPLALLWGVSWVLSRVVRWVAAGFLRRS
jgi:hypothetical protein